MARLIPERNVAPILDAARRWIDACLIEDGSLFEPGRALWTAPTADVLQTFFVERPDSGLGDFVAKTQRQLLDAGADGQKLMAEVMWALLLFPSNVGPEPKRAHVERIWSWSGDRLDATNELLLDSVLQGIGSAGNAFGILRHKEIGYLVALVRSLKDKTLEERRACLTDYDRFLDWIGSVPRDGDRQFRHMLRYFAFPDIVERMSSNGDRIAVLEGFQVASKAQLKRWTDRMLDEAILKLRRQEEAIRPGQIFDFYDSSVATRWRKPKPEKEGPVELVEPLNTDTTARDAPVRATPADRGPINLILYGPPGTGKTHWLRQKFAEYIDEPDQLDAITFSSELIARHGWRAIVAAALADLGGAATVPALRQHRWVQSKIRQRGDSLTNIQQALWNTLQSHAPESSKTVKVARRREPYLFDKRQEGDWHLLPDWEERDEESATLWRALKTGPKAATAAVHRYKVVTFHPSFTYEDFVRGIRPVNDSEVGSTEFRSVDGIFKRICDEAHANPGKRYALFIDEINRANIAKVFGELITLIEADKRAVFDSSGQLVSGMAIQLPGSDDAEAFERPFGVPTNLDIYGTMNTADRSIALLDVALRRRFQFEERGPDYTTLAVPTSDGIDLDKLLRRINDRLEFLLDRDHRIGHAFLINARSVEDVRSAMARQIIPLLQEYFFDDFARVALVLSTTAYQAFLEEDELSFDRLFAGERLDGVPSDRTRFVVTAQGTWTVESFRGIYADTDAIPEGVV